MRIFTSLRYLLPLAAGLIAVTLWTPNAEAIPTSKLTLPFFKPNIAVNSWFDHNLPGSPANNNMRRYDGTQWTDGSAAIANCTLTVNCYDGHGGIDFNLGTNSRVVASDSGSVQFVGWQDPNPNVGFGFYVRLWHSAAGYSTLYGHLLENWNTVSTGQLISGGMLVGYSGSTGQSTGPHLHFGVYNSQSGWTPIDPYGWSGGGSDPWLPDQGYLWQHNPPGYAEYAPAVASWVSNRADQFVRGWNNGLYQRTWNGSSWTGWTQPIAGSCLRSGPAASTWSTTRLDIFVHGCDNAVWHNWWTGGGWPGESLGGCIMSAPGAASWGTNRIGLFVRGCDNVLYKNLYTGSWSGWIAVSGTCLRSGPGAVSWGTNRFDVVYRGCDNAIMHLWSTNGGQSFSSESFGECTMLAPSIASWGSTKLDVFMRGCGPEGSGDGIYRKSYNGSSWSGWTSLGGCLTSGPGTDAWAPDWLDVLYRGCTPNIPPALWEAYWNGGSWTHLNLVSWP